MLNYRDLFIIGVYRPGSVITVAKSGSPTRKKKITSRSRSKTRKSNGRKTNSKKSTSGLRSWLASWALRIVAIGFVVCLVGVVYLDLLITRKFEGQKWALPAHVYTRPLDVYVGQKIAVKDIVNELKELGYRQRDSASQVTRNGQYAFSQNRLDVFLRSFSFWDQVQPAMKATLRWQDGFIIDIVADKPLDDLRIEPRLFGSVSPLNHEDRSLITLAETPKVLTDALLAVEDRNFYGHWGVSPKGIARAFVNNMRAGRTVQGGSTLTQQLVKNYFLTSERTYKRKLTEMIMAMLLELHYSKEEILQAYLNEIYLGQVGNRAIHGFGLGSQYLFGRPLDELDLPEYAMLAGLVKGPSSYNPLRFPDRAKERRDLVLTVMADQGLITPDIADAAKDRPLGTIGSRQQQLSRTYPAFSDLVRQQLRESYDQSDLEAAGLRIFTTLDPRLQSELDSAIKKEVQQIEKDHKLEEGSLQVAALSVRTDNGEVVAMAGARTPVSSGFNRALQSRRPIGSLIKPFVLMAAFKNAPDQYQLTTMVVDEPLTVTQKGSPDWHPKNYDEQFHGDVMLLDVLANSYNVPTVRVGLDVGLEAVASELQQAGLSRQPRKLPSLLLGSLDLSPLEVAQMYLTIAAGGFRTPVTSVRSVLDSAEQPLDRYSLNIEGVFEPRYNNMVSFALQEVVRSGTAATLNYRLSPTLNLAGKTGTTNNYRDTWFAGFSGDLLTVVWVGRDDNKPTGLTGASGAARVWSQYMSRLDLQPVELDLYSELELMPAPSYNKKDVVYSCDEVRQVPIIVGGAQGAGCGDGVELDYDVIYDAETDDAPSPLWRKKKNALNRWLERVFGE